MDACGDVCGREGSAGERCLGIPSQGVDQSGKGGLEADQRQSSGRSLGVDGKAQVRATARSLGHRSGGVLKV